MLLKNFIHPIRIRIFIGIHTRIIFLKSSCIIRSRKTGGSHRFISQVHILSASYQLRQSGRCLHTHISRIGQCSLLFSFSLLGCNQDNPVGRTSSVNSSRCSILQNRHTLYIVGIQQIQISTRNSVNQYKRCGTTIYGTDTTNRY